MRAPLVLGLFAVLGSCAPFPQIFLRNAFQIPERAQVVGGRITEPVRPGAELAVLWVGHATVLLQMGERQILTDPVFVHRVGQLSPRLVEPGLDPADLPPVDACLISHMHFDHLSLGSLDLIEERVGHLFLPRGGLPYVPRRSHPVDTLGPWEGMTVAGDVRVTAVPVDHEGYRYGLDASWMEGGFTGYVVEHAGLTVYFGGDTAYDQALFQATRERFGSIDLALLPIGPIAPRDFMEKTHVDADEAVRAFLDLGAETMIPIHYGTFMHGLDTPEGPLLALREAVARHGVEASRVRALAIGEQVVLRGPGVAPGEAR
ncbi:MAG: MBL fold metallo-hydrolase [Myxococcota bacterium]